MRLFPNRRHLIFFILAATFLMIVADIVFILRAYAPRGEPVHALPVAESEVFTEQHDVPMLPEAKPAWRELNVAEPAREITEGEKYTVERIATPEIITPEKVMEKPVSDFIGTQPEPAPEAEPGPEPFVRPAGAPAKIIVIIDDMGMDRRRSRAIAELPGPLTLAYLPYAPDLPEETGAAKARGHELIIHMPMEPMDQSIDPGPIVLRTGMNDAELDVMLAKAFASFDGYVGINNHMGSKLTQDEHAMRRVMAALKARDLLFVDSKTISSSVASHMAAEAGLRYADRDVFLDNVNSVEAVRKNLHQLERIADRKGYAIAIGHPRDGTIGALREWLPTLKARGFELVPVSSVAHRARVQSATAKATVSPVSSVTSPVPVLPQVQPLAAQPAPY